MQVLTPLWTETTLVSADMPHTRPTQSRFLAGIEDVAPPVIEVPDSLVAVCRAAEEAANLEDVATEQAPVGKITPGLSQPPLHVLPPGIDALCNNNDQCDMVPDDLDDELLGFSAEDSHSDDLASAPDDDDDDDDSHAMPQGQDSGPANEHIFNCYRAFSRIPSLHPYRSLCLSILSLATNSNKCQFSSIHS